MKVKAILKATALNVSYAVGIAIASLVFAQDLENTADTLGMWTNNLFFVSIVVFYINIFARCITNEPVKIIMGYTRKQSFLSTQMIKVLSVLFICIVIAVSFVAIGKEVLFARLPYIFVVLMLMQGVSELLGILYLRLKILGVFTIAAFGAGAGFFTAYFVASVIKTGVAEFALGRQPFSDNSILSIIIAVAVYFVMLLFSWKCYRKIEVRG